ncbi:hypothetical protein GGH92_010405 [Coemansia sp. RSA 2673]|nr:hypothetical protein GGH92_010405 [Coemansia sp. RSA 2673]
MLGASGATFGPWIESHSPRMCAMLAAAVFFFGHCTAALGLACKEISMLYFGYGFVGGIGMGIGYVTTIDAVIQWYPNARGFASGLAVSGFGSGAVAFSNLNAQLVRTFSVPLVFVILGAVNLAIMMMCAMVMRPPPPSHNVPGVAIDLVDQSTADMQYPHQRSVQHTIKGKSAVIGGQTITVGSDSGNPDVLAVCRSGLAGYALLRRRCGRYCGYSGRHVWRRKHARMPRRNLDWLVCGSDWWRSDLHQRGEHPH